MAAKAPGVGSWKNGGEVAGVAALQRKRATVIRELLQTDNSEGLQKAIVAEIGGRRRADINELLTL